MRTNYLRNPRNTRHSGALPEHLKDKVVETVSRSFSNHTYQDRYYLIHQIWTYDADGNLLKLEEEWSELT
ncbi:hypothetical protein VP249E411_P0132 [Vibrio phage 249E41-1]|nr:hypothetical protein VP249E411_P0132 [Vibrio phage 249E41-1]CAH9017102.1 hypothetical protein VP193E371_P0130 [Vibrio phage 193E37-1]